MSHAALIHVLEHTKVLKAHQLVLLRLADHATESGLAWPSHSLLARETGYTREYVIRVMHDLVAQGAVTEVFDAKGRRRYQLPVYDFKQRRCSCEHVPPSQQALDAWEGIPTTSPSIDGGVYLIRCEDAYKIGQSASPDVRLDALRTGMPNRGTLVHVIQSQERLALERTFQNFFAPKRTHREWFNLTPEDVELFCRYPRMEKRADRGTCELTLQVPKETEFPKETVNSVNGTCELSSAGVNSAACKSRHPKENATEPLTDEPEQTGAHAHEPDADAPAWEFRPNHTPWHRPCGTYHLVGQPCPTFGPERSGQAKFHDKLSAEGP